MHPTWQKIQEYLRKIGESFYHFNLKKEITGYKSVLDVGCGANSPLGKIPKNFHSTGIDIFRRSIVESKKKKIHNAYKLGDVRKLNKYFKKKSFDVVLALDVIEHFKKKEALKIISQMEDIARKKVILLTPNGYYQQEALGGNIHQIHKSGWESYELQEMGYAVNGLRGLKWLRGEHANIRFRPWLFWGALSFISEFIFYNFTQLSFDLFAVKEIHD